MGLELESVELTSPLVESPDKSQSVWSKCLRSSLYSFVGKERELLTSTPHWYHMSRRGPQNRAQTKI